MYVDTSRPPHPHPHLPQTCSPSFLLSSINPPQTFSPTPTQHTNHVPWIVPHPTLPSTTDGRPAGRHQPYYPRSPVRELRLVRRELA
ncbi:hypothetical protein BKA81DRAFT_145942 [Phyllosticta paracitricarpa]